MRESVKVIKWCGAISTAFLVLTYAATVNNELHFISVDSVWTSNSFFISLFGGVFASMLVVALCEVRKYLSSKANTEQYLFCHSLYLYQALTLMRTVIKNYLDHCEWRITENLLDESTRMIQCEMGALQATDYATFKHSDGSLMIDHGRFRKEGLPKLQPLLRSGLRLRLAISETDLENLERQRETHAYFEPRERVTSGSKRVAQTLNEELEMVCSSIALVDGYITSLDNCCHNRFKWDDLKGQLVCPHLDNPASD